MPGPDPPARAAVAGGPRRPVLEAAPPLGPAGAGGRRRAGHEVSEGGREKSERERESAGGREIRERERLLRER